MNLRINAGVCTHVGRVGNSNGDNFFLNGSFFTGKSEKKGLMRCRESGDPVQLYAVFDGMGDESAGEEASALGASLMRNLLDDLRGGEEFMEAVNRYAALANDAVASLGKGAGSTLAVLCIRDGVAHAAWLGNSRIYLLRNGGLTRITDDHTGERQRYLGMGASGAAAMPSCAADIPLKRKDVFLLCTDGLTDLVDDKKIVGMLENAKVPERELVGAALKAGGTDNVTVLAVDLIQFRKPLALFGKKV